MTRCVCQQAPNIISIQIEVVRDLFRRLVQLCGFHDSIGLNARALQQRNARNLARGAFHQIAAVPHHKHYFSGFRGPAKMRFNYPSDPPQLHIRDQVIVPLFEDQMRAFARWPDIFH